MADETEEIEARLCAYIDGELDDAARAEIERHLASNPRHRQLMEEMERGKRLLGSLPRVPAPPEIEESVHTHLERSVLLDDGPGDSAPLRINRRPQIVAAAAILILAIGLAVIVWLVIRPPSHGPSSAANLPPPSPAATAPSQVRMETAEPAQAPRHERSDLTPSAATSYASAGSREPVPAYGRADNTAAHSNAPAASRPAVAGETAPIMAKPAAFSQNTGQSLEMLAYTEDAGETELRLRAFLVSQGLPADAMDLPSAASLWPSNNAGRAFLVRGMRSEQVQALREVLNASAQTTVIAAMSPAHLAATSQPAADHQIVNLIVMVRPPTTGHGAPSSPAAPSERVDQPRDPAPASQPTTAPAAPEDWEPMQMP